MKKEQLTEFIVSEFTRFALTLGRYQWPWESARWHELVFCLMARVDDSPQALEIARETTSIFSDLDLLVVESLAKITPSKGEPKLDEPQLGLMLKILERQGYSEEEAKTIVISICQAARSLQDAYDGKIQKYLRQYGEKMLAELPQHFSFSRLSAADTRYAFTHWLQNVVNMPVLLSEPMVDTLCREFEVTVDELAAIADRNNINAALIDDWAADYMRQQATTKA